MKPKNILVTLVVVLVLAGIIVGAVWGITASRKKRALTDLQTARDLLANGKTEPALAILKENVVKYPKAQTTPEALYILGKIFHENPNTAAEAATVFERLLADFPQSPFSKQALFYRALALLDEKPVKEETRAFFLDLKKNPVNAQAAAVAEYALALDSLAKGEKIPARDAMTGLLEGNLPEELRARVEKELGDLNMKILMNPDPDEGDEVYEIKKGDYIYDIARKYKVPQELILKCNGISDPKRMSIGQNVKIPRPSFSLLVDKYTNTMTLLNKGRFFKKYRIRTGSHENKTPVGTFTIQNKKSDPRWVNPRTLKVYPGGDPENELGSRWMSFKDDDLGIHGTIKPETVGYYSSFGCVGMLKEDVEELFDIIPVGTPLKIVGEMNPEIVEKSKALGYRD
ncbi:MAG TPA: L,D-transpeptidase family protein [Candidatus Sumerlaeota bacterium]|nr:L,D-transpeptidase family protein [Candidatus Sumerlaeota bacterium]